MINLICAFRSIFRARWDNAAKIVSLALGLSVGLVIFSVMTFHLSYDNFFTDKDRVYQMRCTYELNGEKDESDMLWAPIAPALTEDIPGVESATRMFRSGKMDYSDGEHWFSESTIFGDSLLFDVLDFGALRGNPRTGLSGRNNAFLSEPAAQRMFGDEDPVGKTIFYNNTPLTITGVFGKVPDNCHVRLDVILSLASVENMMNAGSGWGGGDSYLTYAKIAPDVKIGDIEAALPAFFKKHGQEEELREWGMSFFFVPISDVHSGDRDVVRNNILLGVLALVILFIAALNFVLLTLSSLADRARTIGVHKCSGARASNVFSMLLAETALYIVVSTLIAAGVILALSPQIMALTGESLASLFAPQRLWFAVTTVAGLFVVAGVLPARVFASVPVTAAYRPATPGRRAWKRALLFVQFAAAAFVLIFLVVVVRQYQMFLKKDLGYDFHNVAYMHTPPTSGEEFNSIRTELLSLPQVEDVSVAFDMFIGLSGQPAYNPETKELLFGCRITGMDSLTIPLLGIEIVAGANFTEEMGWNHVIVNEKYVELMHWTDDPIGKLIRDETEGDLKTIVGVTRDFMTNGLQYGIQPLVIHAAKMRPEGRLYERLLLIKLSGMTRADIEAVNKKLAALYPGQQVGVQSYAETIGSMYSTEKELRNTVFIVGITVLLIALAGMVGYISYELRRRSREIAIRKIHGAGRGDILRVVSADIAVMVAAALLVGAAAAWYAGGQWLSQFAYKVQLSWWIFAAGAGTVLLVVAATVLLKTRAILRENPVKSIKTE